MNRCSADNCDREIRARDLCGKHLHRLYRGQDINTLSCYEKSDFERFMDNVGITDNCWHWTAGTRGRKPLAYGAFWYQGRKVSAHRYMWSIHNGPIPKQHEGEPTEICHTCDNCLCVNPEHLFIGNTTINMRDKISKGRCGQANKTHCPQGHAYDQKNTYVNKVGGRMCRECGRLREAARRKLIN